MKPISFPEQTMVIAENQPEYLGLPACVSPDGEVVSCWQLSIWERVKILWTGKVWVQTLTFNQAVQPLFLGVDYPFETEPTQ